MKTPQWRPLLTAAFLCATANSFASEPTQAYFGDLHVHTGFSTDARIYGTLAGPDDAYRFAKGESIAFQQFGDIQLKYGALDFLAVTDHAESLGVLGSVDDPAIELDFPVDSPLAAHRRLSESKKTGKPHPSLNRPDLTRSAWQQTIAAAHRHYQPGQFTTFVGFEWTMNNALGSAHRNVIFKGAAVPAMPYSMYDSVHPEDLWAWLDQQRAQGNEGLAIPHNSNLSGGQVWAMMKSSGEAIDIEWIKQRARNEPIVEMSQIKGTSETHPLLSDEDNWANFEIYAQRKPLLKRLYASVFGIDDALEKQRLAGSYVRPALQRGLQLQQRFGENPFRFGFIGSTDTHNAASTFEEDNYISKGGKMTASPQARLLGSEVSFLEKMLSKRQPSQWGAGSLAAVWAKENTRDAIYGALQRRESYATTGTRIRVRFFAGYDFDESMLQQSDWVATAYTGGVAMGGELHNIKQPAKTPRFLLWASRDVNSAPLQRLQIIKGWIENGTSHERVFDVALADDTSGRVDTKTGQWDEQSGAGELSAFWHDPTFKPEQAAFYYVRVLENPTLRWSSHDANTLGIAPLEELPVTIQERAYTSPIWYIP